VQTAERWPTLLPTARPVFDPRQIRTAAPELRAIASLLRSSPVDARGVALVERLLTSGGFRPAKGGTSTGMIDRG